jgi:hypothetical protein
MKVPPYDLIGFLKYSLITCTVCQKSHFLKIAAENLTLFASPSSTTVTVVS